MRCLLIVPLIGALLHPIPSPAQTLTEAQRLEIALEALNRIESDPGTNATLQAALDQVLGQLRGKPEFVRLVKKFNLKNQAEGLLEVARTDPAGESGVEAIRLLLANNGIDPLKSALNDASTRDASKLVEALGNAKEKAVVPLLSPVATNSTREVSVRKVAVRALVQTQEGTKELLSLVRSGDLPGDLRLTGSEQLNAVRWPELKAEAADLLPRPKSRHSEPLPPLAELARMKGDIANGEKIYFTETVACGNCHQVRGRGTEVGPNLSEIGTKLAREAIFEAILEPSAGVSLGYEAHLVELKSGDEAYGLLASETDDELAIKDLTGLVTRYQKSDIAARTQLTTSIMPTGLTESLSAQELVDLVEFLQSLKVQ